MVYWNNRQERDVSSMEKLFQTFTLNELTYFDDYIIRLQESITTLDEEKRT